MNSYDLDSYAKNLELNHNIGWNGYSGSSLLDEYKGLLKEINYLQRTDRTRTEAYHEMATEAARLWEYLSPKEVIEANNFSKSLYELTQKELI